MSLSSRGAAGIDVAAKFATCFGSDHFVKKNVWVLKFISMRMIFDDVGRTIFQHFTHLLEPSLLSWSSSTDLDGPFAGRGRHILRHIHSRGWFFRCCSSPPGCMQMTWMMKRTRRPSTPSTPNPNRRRRRRPLTCQSAKAAPAPSKRPRAKHSTCRR